jgi:hypothetical protein
VVHEPAVQPLEPRASGAVADGIGSLQGPRLQRERDGDGPDEIGDLTAEYNSLGDSLRRERLNLYQRELLLDTGRADDAARARADERERPHRLRQHRGAAAVPRGRKIEGIRFGELLADSPQPLRDAVDGGVDTLFSVSQGTEGPRFST